MKNHADRSAGLSIVLAMLIGGATIALSYLSLESAWARWLLLPAVVAGIYAVERLRRWERRRQWLFDSLEGTLPAKELDSVIARPRAFVTEPAARELTLLSVDIAGFSPAAGRLGPSAALHALRNVQDVVSRTVHEHGGILDGIGSERIVAFFGYRTDGSTNPGESHASVALACAAELQRRVASVVAEAKGEGLMAALPVRVGVETEMVYVGDLGRHQRIELRVIGDGVDFARRLEASCDPFRILVGPKAKERLAEADPRRARLVSRHVLMRRFDDLLEVFELDPLLEDMDLRSRATGAVRATAAMARTEERLKVGKARNAVAIAARSEYGAGLLINYAASGLAVRWDRYLGRGVPLTLELVTDDGKLQAKLRDEDLSPISCEVRWGEADGTDGAILGLALRGVSETKRRKLVDELTRASQRPTLKKVAGGKKR